MILRFLLVLALASAAVAQTAVAPAPTAIHVPAHDISAKLDQIFGFYNRATGPGCAVGVRTSEGEPVAAAYGKADLEHNVANMPDTVFEAGSVTKQFTAAAVLLLVERGRLSLDDDIRRYFPEMPEYDAPIRIRDLLYHTSGLRDWGEIEAIAGWPRGSRVYTHAHVLDILSRQHALNYPVGTAWSYTNSGYNLAAMLVERVAGKTLNAFTQAEFFAPLGMTSTQWRDNFRHIVPNRAVAYSRGPNGLQMDMPFENIYGNGGLLTTVGDLLKWNQNQEDGKVGGRALLDLQQKRATLRDGTPLGYAAGLFVGTWRGQKEFSHSGATAGYRAWLARLPDQHVSVAILCNDAAANTTQLGHDIAGLFLSDPEQGNHAAAPTTNFNARAGLYRSPRDYSTITFEQHDGHLRLKDGPSLELLPNGRLTTGTTEIWFETTADGHPDRVRIANPVYGSDWWEKVEPALPTLTQLAAFIGEYKSDEAEVNFQIKLENGGLLLDRRPATAFAMKPLYQDAFTADLGTIRFLRDSSGTVTGLSVSQGRVWDLRFERVSH